MLHLGLQCVCVSMFLLLRSAYAETPSAVGYLSESASPTPLVSLAPGAAWAVYREQEEQARLDSLPEPSTLPTCNVTQRDIVCVHELGECKRVNPALPDTEVHRHGNRPGAFYDQLEENRGYEETAETEVEQAQDWTFGYGGLSGPLGGGVCTCYDRFGDCLVEAGCGRGSIPFGIEQECKAVPQCRQSQCEGTSGSQKHAVAAGQLGGIAWALLLSVSCVFVGMGAPAHC